MKRAENKLKPRQRKILQALAALGGEATQREIAKEAGLNTNGVSQSLGSALADWVDYLGDKKWRLKT